MEGARHPRRTNFLENLVINAIERNTMTFGRSALSRTRLLIFCLDSFFVAGRSGQPDRFDHHPWFTLALIGSFARSARA
jgi:hypothetical protein